MCCNRGAPRSCHLPGPAHCLPDPSTKSVHQCDLFRGHRLALLHPVLRCQTGLGESEENAARVPRLPPPRTKIIHVAGTNGKGSTCAFIDSVARAAGTRTGLFTSPHLVRYSERIRVAGMEITEDEISRHLTALRALVTDWDPHPTFFEISLALALRHFSERNCELVILETGMGGRLDATTAVPADVAVITPISLDHQQWLGETLVEIAAEKAAIICHKKPTFSAPRNPPPAPSSSRSPMNGARLWNSLINPSWATPSDFPENTSTTTPPSRWRLFTLRKSP